MGLVYGYEPLVVIMITKPFLEAFEGRQNAFSFIPSINQVLEKLRQ